jgi:predicted DsbA family dithiol-disulfide isomerase
VKRVKFYHSVICPRCHASNLLLASILRDRPGVEVTRVELLTNRALAKQDGVRSIPTLVAEDGRTLSGTLLTPGRVRRFLDSLDATT